MFKSIFKKYIVTFMLIIVIGFTLLASVICTMTVSHYNSIAEKQLAGETVSMRRLIEERYGASGDDSLEEYIREHKSDIDEYTALFRHTDSSVHITDIDGHVIASIGAGTIADDIPNEIMDEVLNGVYSDTGKLGGALKKKTIYSGTVICDDSGEKIGAVFILNSAASVNKIVKTTVKTLIMVWLWVTFAAMIAVYYLSDRIVSPIKHMSKAAKEFATGNFDVRVEVKGHDETAELAVAFNNMADSLADLENMRSTFLSNVSHDLRTPMTTISGLIDGILDGTIPPQKHEYYLRTVSEEVKRLSRLVTALLDVTRIQAGDRKFVMGVFDICEMARLILISFEQSICQKHLDVSFETDNDNMYVCADRDAIYQILYNLCDNAVKFSRDGGKYRIKIIEHDKKVFISVYNEGNGITAEDLPHVFDRFYKCDKSRGLDKTGTGLGLYIAKSIIDAHGEEIWVNSMYGEYCEFVFTLSPASENGKNTRKSLE